MQAHSVVRNSLDRTKIDAIVVPILHAHGAELVDIELKSEPGGWVLRILVEKLGSAEKKANTKESAVDLGLCSDVARELSPALDVVDVIPHRYNLEVGSPGVERVLRHAADFERFRGEKAKLKLAREVAGLKIVKGTIETVAAGAVKIDASGKAVEVPLADIEKANLVFEFGPAPKPGKQSKPGKK